MELLVSQCAARLIIKLNELKRDVERKRQSLDCIEEVEEDIMQLEDKLDILCRQLAELL